jgi:hypothetical protein
MISPNVEFIFNRKNEKKCMFPATVTIPCKDKVSPPSPIPPPCYQMILLIGFPESSG